MSENKFLKSYSLNIDFKNYGRKGEVSCNLVYSEGDVNTAYLYANLLVDKQPIDLNNWTKAIALVKTSNDESLMIDCEIVDPLKGEIIVPFSTTSLSGIGLNKFEIVLYGDKKQMSSPTLSYRVVESLQGGTNIENDNNYDILLVLISQVQGVIDATKEATTTIKNLETEIQTNETERIASELQRKDNEIIMLQNEQKRQEQEVARQTSFNTKISEVNEVIQKVEKTLDSTITDFSSQFTAMQNTFDEKVVMIDGKVLEFETQIAEAISEIDADIEQMFNTRFDTEMTEANTRLDELLEEKTTEKFLEVDTTISDKLTEVDTVVTVGNEKIAEITTATETNNKKIDDKIVEINVTKTQLVNTVNQKIEEVDTAKTDLTSSIDVKMVDFENRFDALESANPTGEITQARIGVDGTINESLQKRLSNDFGTKADKTTTYTKDEVDEKVNNVTSVDDATISLDSTWSSNKISTELNGKESIANVDTKVNKAKQDAQTYADEKIATLVGQSPELLDTLEELSSALGNDPNFATSISEQIAQKADKDKVYSKEEIDIIVSASTSIDDAITSGLTTWSSNKISAENSKKVDKVEGKVLSSNDFTTSEKTKLQGLTNYTHPNDANTRHVTDVQIAKWESKAEGNHTHSTYALTNHQHSYSELNDKPTIPSKTSELQNDKGFVTQADIHTHTNKEVLDTINTEKVTAWDNKSDFSGNYNDLTNTPTDLAQKEYVDTQLTTKADKITVYTKEEVDTLMSSSMPTNPSFDKLILVEEWTEDLEFGYSFAINHKLNTDRIFIGAIDNNTKNGVLVGYKIVDENNIIVYLESPIEALVTIINGDSEVDITNESDSKKLILFDKEVVKADWTMEEDLATLIVTHKLFTEKVFVSAIDIETNKSLQIAYQVVDKTKVKVSILNPKDAVITFLSGEREFVEITTDVDDSQVKGSTAWSSAKVDSLFTEVNQTLGNEDLNTTQKNVIGAINELKASEDTTVEDLLEVIGTMATMQETIQNQQLVIDKLVSDVNTLTTEIDGQRVKAIELANSLESKL